MAGRPRKAMVVEIPSDEDEGKVEDTRSDVERLSDAEIEESRENDSRSAYETIKRVDDDTGEEAWVGRAPVKMVNSEFLAKKYGKGKFICYTKKFVNGKWVLAGSRIVNVGTDLRPAPDAMPLGGGGGSGDFSRDLLMTMMKQSTENAQTMVTMMTGMMTAMTGAFATLKPAAPTTDPLMLAILQSVIQRRDPTEIAAELAKAFKPETTETDLLSQLQKFAEIRSLFTGGEERETNELDLVAKGLDTVRALAAGAPSATVARPLQESTGEQPMASMKPAPADVAVVVEGPEWWRAVAPRLPQLLQAAAIMPPGAAAATLAGLLQSGGYWPSLVEDVSSDTGGTLPAEPDEHFGDAFASRTVQRFPGGLLTESVKPWATAVLLELADLTLPEEPAEPEDEPDAK